MDRISRDPNADGQEDAAMGRFISISRDAMTARPLLQVVFAVVVVLAVVLPMNSPFT